MSRLGAGIVEVARCGRELPPIPHDRSPSLQLLKTHVNADTTKIAQRLFDPRVGDHLGNVAVFDPGHLKQGQIRAVWMTENRPVDHLEEVVVPSLQMLLDDSSSLIDGDLIPYQSTHAKGSPGVHFHISPYRHSSPASLSANR